jgi:osmoprotectant transport system permease protein
LGEGFFSGLARIGSATALYLVLGALLAVMVLALLFDIGFLVLKRVVTSKGIRN